MRRTNIGVLKNQLSAYLKLVRNGEEVVVCDRNIPIARILPFRPASTEPEDDFAAEQERLIAAGLMTRSRNEIEGKEMDWEAFWAIPTGNVSDEAVKEAMDWVKGEY